MNFGCNHGDADAQPKCTFRYNILTEPVFKLTKAALDKAL